MLESVARFLHAGHGVVLRLFGGRRVVNLELAKVESYAGSLRRYEPAGTVVNRLHARGVLDNEAEVLVIAAEVDYR